MKSVQHSINYYSVIYDSNGGKCGVVEWVKRNTLMWFSHMMREKSIEFVKKVYVNEIDGRGGGEGQL